MSFTHLIDNKNFNHVVMFTDLENDDFYFLFKLLTTFKLSTLKLVVQPQHSNDIATYLINLIPQTDNLEWENVEIIDSMQDMDDWKMNTRAR